MARVLDHDFKMIDLYGPSMEVEVTVSDQGDRLWVNIDGKCALRICGIPAGILRIDDQRKG